MAAMSASCLSETVMGGMWSETRWMALSLQQQKTWPFSICTATPDSVIWDACTVIGLPAGRCQEPETHMSTTGRPLCGRGQAQVRQRSQTWVTCAAQPNKWVPLCMKQMAGTYRKRPVAWLSPLIFVLMLPKAQHDAYRRWSCLLTAKAAHALKAKPSFAVRGYVQLQGWVQPAAGRHLHEKTSGVAQPILLNLAPVWGKGHHVNVGCPHGSCVGQGHVAVHAPQQHRVVWGAAIDPGSCGQGAAPVCLSPAKALQPVPWLCLVCREHVVTAASRTWVQLLLTCVSSTGPCAKAQQSLLWVQLDPAHALQALVLCT